MPVLEGQISVSLFEAQSLKTIFGVSNPRQWHFAAWLGPKGCRGMFRKGEGTCKVPSSYCTLHLVFSRAAVHRP